MSEQPTEATDDRGRKGFLGRCSTPDCGSEGQVISPGCHCPVERRGPRHTDCKDRIWVCVPCWWEHWR